MHLSKPIEDTTLRVNPKGNYGLWVVMMYQYKFISGLKKKNSILMSDVGKGGGYGHVGRECNFFV